VADAVIDAFAGTGNRARSGPGSGQETRARLRDNGSYRPLTGSGWPWGQRFTSFTFAPLGTGVLAVPEERGYKGPP
jgi:hypothetical protein